MLWTVVLRLMIFSHLNSLFLTSVQSPPVGGRLSRPTYEKNEKMRRYMSKLWSPCQRQGGMHMHKQPGTFWHCYSARSEGQQYHHMCCHLQWLCPLPNTNYRPIQYSTPHHISQCTEWKTGSTWRERAVEAWHGSVCHNWRQRCLPPLSPYEWMVCSKSLYDDAISPYTLSFFESNWGVYLCLEMEGVWLSLLVSTAFTFSDFASVTHILIFSYIMNRFVSTVLCLL